MGFDLTRFIGEVDGEFHCSICKLVLEDPVQTPCEHSFCKKCIKDWLLITLSCPVDRKELTFSDIKPSSRPFRNLCNKLDIKCDFEPQGCSAVVKLESLKSHVATCEYNLNAEVVCDKGCNTTITRGEYKNNNCFSHLANRVSAQEKENMRVTNELGSVQERLSSVQEELSSLQKLMKDQKKHFEKIVNDQRDEISNLYNDLCLLRPLKWQCCFNVKILESNILNVDDPRKIGIVQSDYPLQSRKSFFKIEILDLNPPYSDSWIGLNSKISDLNNVDKGLFGISFLDRSKPRSVQLFCVVGDIIECGIKFTKNFVNDGENRALAYIYNNNKNEVFTELLTIPKEGLFPMVVLHDRGTRFRYYH